MQNIEVLDLLFTIEVLLSYTSGPLTQKSIKNMVEMSTALDKGASFASGFMLPNGNFCTCIGTNDWLFIYKEQKKGIYKYKMFDTYYFKIKDPFFEVQKLTEDNLLESFQNTAEEVDIHDFLRKNRGVKKEQFIKKLLCLDLQRI